MVDEVGSAREASRELRRQEDGQDEGGNKVFWEDEQDEEGNKGFRRQDDEHDEGDKRQTESHREVVWRQSEDDMQQDGDGRGQVIGDETRGDKDERRGKMGKGSKAAETRVGRKMEFV